jgi:hypothetical protein
MKCAKNREIFPIDWENFLRRAPYRRDTVHRCAGNFSQQPAQKLKLRPPMEDDPIGGSFFWGASVSAEKGT